MPTLEEHLEGVINVFHQYSVRVDHFDTLSKSELKKLIQKELPNTMKNTKDKGSIDKLFQDLDKNGDQQVDFKEFLVLLGTLLQTAHEDSHRE